MFSCSNDDSTNEQQTIEFPTNITLSSQTAEIGDILTINGNGFLVNESYIVTFSDNVIANITEINSSFLKVEIPENAESGNISLTLHNQTEVIGSIEINNIVTNDVYIFHGNANKLAKIDLTTGNLTYIGSNIDYGSNPRGAIYHSEYNEYIAFESEYPNPYLVRINLSDGSSTITEIPSSFLIGDDFSFRDLIIDDNNDVYIFHGNANKLAKIDLTTGNLTYIGSNIDYGSNPRGAIYHSEYNEYIAFESEYPNPYLVRINLSDGSSTITEIPSSFLINGDDFSFRDLMITKN